VAHSSPGLRPPRDCALVSHHRIVPEFDDQSPARPLTSPAAMPLKDLEPAKKVVRLFGKSCRIDRHRPL